MTKPNGPQFYQFVDEDYGDGNYNMRAMLDGRTVAAVRYNELSSEEDRPTVSVDYLQSHEEGKGHARQLMQNLYDKYGSPTVVDWGFTVHPAATHLAEQFWAKYPHRTDFIENED